MRSPAGARRARPDTVSPPAPRPLPRPAALALAACALAAHGTAPAARIAPLEAPAPAASLAPAAPVAAPVPVTADAVERALAGARPAMSGWRTSLELDAPRAVRALYAARDHRPVWTSAAAVRTLRAALADARADGLAPIGTGTDGPDPFDDTGPDAALRDVRLTDLLLTLVDRLRRGQTDPGAVAAPDGGAADAGTDPDGALDAHGAARLSARLDAGDVAAVVADARPATPLYAGLRDALARHHEAADVGGLPMRVGDGPTIETGSEGARTERLRRRLAALDALDGLHGTDRYAGRLTESPPALAGVPGSAFDGHLERAVRAFQERHGLEADGKVGRLTRAAIDAGLDERIERLRVNLERARHIALALGESDRIVVNVADQRLSLELDGRTTWETDVVVGQRKHRTPVHVGTIEWMELDPRWTVPRKIVLDTLYERAKADPAAFAHEGFVLRDLGGTLRDPREIDWETMTPARFHYDVIQRPGPRNPLGRAKFMFPNRYAVYLHDTPNRALFEEDQRAFSRGCVRVEDADTLAALLLEHRNGERRPDIVTLRAAADEVRIDLERPLTVALLYWTAEVDDEGRLRTIDDLYGRDAAVARELDAAAAS